MFELLKRRDTLSYSVSLRSVDNKVSSPLGKHSKYVDIRNPNPQLFRW